jgi:hypothetical protein
MATVTLSKIEKAVLEAVAKRKDGIGARELANSLAHKYNEFDVQRVMRLALDRGDFELGPKLQIQITPAPTQSQNERAEAHAGAGPVPKRTGRAAARRLKK